MSSFNYKSSKAQNDKVALLEQKVQMLTQQLEEQQHINENYEIYKEQLYSQMEKYVEIIDYTMKLLYKFNEFIKSKSDEAVTYSDSQIKKVSEEEQQFIQKLHGLYSLSEPSLENLKGVEEYQIVGEDTQVTIISKIQGVAKIVVDNIKILGQNCLQHEKLKFYTAEKIVSLNKQQEKIEQEHKYITLQIQKEIQQNTASQIKDQSMLAHSIPNIQQQQHVSQSDGTKNNDMWVEIVSKLVEYCTTLQINQMQIQNQLNQAVQKLFDQDYKNSNTKVKRQENSKEQDSLQEELINNLNKDDVQNLQQEAINRSSRSGSRELNIYHDQIENLQQLQTIIESVQKKETQNVSPNQKLQIQKQMEKIKLETSNHFLKQTSDSLNNNIMQNQSNSFIQNIPYQSNGQQLEKSIEKKQFEDNFSLLQQSRTKQKEPFLSSNGKQKNNIDLQRSQERIPAGRGSRSPYLQQNTNQSQLEVKVENFMQDQCQNYKSVTQSSYKKCINSQPSTCQQANDFQNSSKQADIKTSQDSESQKQQLYEQVEQEDKRVQINQFECDEQIKTEERVPAGRSLASSKIKCSFEQNRIIDDNNNFQMSSKDEKQIKSYQSNCSETNFSNKNLKVQSLKQQQMEQNYESQHQQESHSNLQNQQIQIKITPPTINSEVQNNQKHSSFQSQDPSDKIQIEEYQYKYQTNKSNGTEQNSVQLSKRSLEFPQAINKISISDQILLDVENQSHMKQLNTSYKSPNFCMNDKSKFQSTASEKPALGFQSISQFNRFSSLNNNSNAQIAQQEDNSNNSQVNNNKLKTIDSSRHQLQISEFSKNEKEEQILNFFQGKFNLEDETSINPPHLSSLHNKLERITHQIFPQRNSSSSNSQQDLQSIYSSEQQDYPQQMRQSKSRERIFSYNNSHTSSRQLPYNNNNQSNAREFANNRNHSTSNMSYIDKNKLNNNSNLCVNSSQEWQFSVQQQQNTQQTNLQNSISRISKTEMSWNSFENIQIPLRQSLQQPQQQQLSLRSLMNVVNQQRINSNRSVSNTNRRSNNDLSQNQNDSNLQQQAINMSSNLSINPLDQSQLNRSRLSQGRRKIFETYESHRSQDEVRQQQLSHDSSRRQVSQYETANLGVNNNEKTFYSTNNHLDSSRISANQQYQSNNTNYRKPPQYQQSSRNDGSLSGGVSQRTDRNPYSYILNEQNLRETFKVQIDNNYNSNQNKENNIQVMQKSSQRYLSQGVQNNRSTHNLSQERMSQQSQRSKEPLSEQSQNVSIMSNKSQKQFYSISEISKMNQQQTKEKKPFSKNYL
ncbi:hypothetical protein TTHERM_00215910 (macronuclear) [Tetrahymena thermophila SB210]|uniref:Uncharacterized protein n=1 Tax=Tetrahymena thermophila (strain SB210) TaxID=312017 RepID=I7M2E1_TETTS|nr:hypothetical protein TTHERM_00215910 [Tetrahymena thermophila SB210]EAS00216.1 hypothetical protein TTHERM_00215910 [Tetrahymena thermophila SB210]|eukprot:XP_001020461.1 hypothetical protein TTHERM_00215910 [Tetrahymena thermophila SB210]